MSDKDESKASTDPVSEAIHSKDSQLPRAIRHRVGQVQDPVPEGKQLAAQPQAHALGVADEAQPLTIHQEKEARKDKQHELRRMNEDKPEKYPNLAMNRRGLDPQTGSISKANFISQRKS